MAEWLKAHAWKACVRETVPWVRIPLSPPPRLTENDPRGSMISKFGLFCEILDREKPESVAGQSSGGLENAFFSKAFVPRKTRSALICWSGQRC
jgi:hypothetical protein